ncbi:hypothetical protein [Streptomyces mirabilis]
MQRDDQRGQFEQLARFRADELGDVLGDVPDVQPGRFGGPPGHVPGQDERARVAPAGGQRFCCCILVLVEEIQ